ncbi:hypothetical protein [Streptomyces cyanogenus]|uniref:hypothetical protein n=1 Tax=Streptomyces cyanogenus TaxID=80860 RepID=UPI001AA18195|nr:hypothetical protein [Streptomyces cyanogenus]
MVQAGAPGLDPGPDQGGDDELGEPETPGEPGTGKTSLLWNLTTRLTGRSSLPDPAAETMPNSGSASPATASHDPVRDDALRWLADSPYLAQATMRLRDSAVRHRRTPPTDPAWPEALPGAGDPEHAEGTLDR